MNALMLIGATATGRASALAAGGNECALLLFLSGAVSLAIAAYLLSRAPKFEPIRHDRRHLPRQ
jgi:hypothetical protein